MANELLRRLGIDVPVFAFSHCRDVVAAVSRAGGFGVLGGGMLPEQLEIELAWLDAHTDGRPYGIDFLMPSGAGSAPQPEEDAVPPREREYAEELLRRKGVDALPEEDRRALQRFLAKKFAITPAQHEELIAIAMRHRIRLIAAGLGVPPRHLIDAAHEKGILVAALVGDPVQAMRQRDAGVDLLVAQGSEAGGHTGSISTMVLVPQIVDLVRPMPVLAAGGIADGRQMAAAMCLGASGVWCGSVWLTTAESDVDPLIKQRLLAAGSRDAVISKAMTGKRNRVLKSEWSEWWERPGAPVTLPMPLQHFLAQEVMQRARRKGAAELMSYPAGQIIGQISSETSVREVIMSMLDGYVEAVTHVADLMSLPESD